MNFFKRLFTRQTVVQDPSQLLLTTVTQQKDSAIASVNSNASMITSLLEDTRAAEEHFASQLDYIRLTIANLQLQESALRDNYEQAVEFRTSLENTFKLPTFK